MASFPVSAARVQGQFILGFPSTPEISSIHTVKLSSISSPSFSSLRCEGARRLKINQRLLTVSAADPSSTVGKSPNEGSDVKETSSGNVSQGPPLRTIFAGFVVFFIVCWILGSIIMWLISLIVNPPPPK